MKAQDTTEATHALLPHLSSTGVVVSVQNGLNERVIGEVDAIVSVVVEIGRQHNVPTPLSARLVELIHEIEAGRKEQGRERLREMRL